MSSVSDGSGGAGCPRCEGSGWVCASHPDQPMGHPDPNLPDGKCRGVGMPCEVPQRPFRWTGFHDDGNVIFGARASTMNRGDEWARTQFGPERLQLLWRARTRSGWVDAAARDSMTNRERAAFCDFLRELTRSDVTRCRGPTGNDTVPRVKVAQLPAQSGRRGGSSHA